MRRFLDARGIRLAMGPAPSREVRRRFISQIRQIAFGSVLHTVQDSFAAAHVSREPGPSSQTCEGTRTNAAPTTPADAPQTQLSGCL